MNIIAITDPADPRIAPYRDVRERDLRGRQHGFLAEGQVVVDVLLRSPLCRARSLLIAEARLPRLTALLAKVPDETPIYVAGQDVLDGIAGFHLHRGILAFGERLEAPSAASLLTPAGPAIVLALIGVSNHDNIGGLFRNAAAFAARAVLLDATCCDPLYRKAIRVSVGAALRTPFARCARGEDLVDLLQAHGFAPLAFSPAGETPLAGLVRPARAALLLGAEGSGLPEAVLARCRTVSIPMAAGFDSLNVATAGGIALHHLACAAPPCAAAADGV